MRLAIPIWAGRVSPLMDTAEQLLVLELAEKEVVSRQNVVIPHTNHSHRAAFMKHMGIDTLICGAISRHLERVLTSSGIKTYAWVRGDVEGIIEAFLTGVLHQENYSLPGCWRRRHGGGGRCRRPGGRRSKGRQFEEES